MPTSTATASITLPKSGPAIRTAIQRARTRLGDAPPTIGIAFVSPQLSLSDALSEARHLLPSTEWLGCTTAGEITENGLTHGGLSLMLVSAPEMSFAVEYSQRAKTPDLATKELTRRFPELRRNGNVGTTVLLVDGLCGTGEHLVELLQREAGGTLHEIVGGAAGDEGKFVATFAGTHAAASSGSAVALHAFGAGRWGIGVDHGLVPSSKPMRVTRADGNVVLELDGRPAFEVYRDYASSRGVTLTRENASAFLINNELGILLFDSLKKARAPISVTAGGGLACAAEVPQGAQVSILDGSRDSLVRAAERAAREAKDRLGTREAAGVLLFDCICRGAILESEFQREIEAVAHVFPNTPIAGFLTYGEIARYSGRLDGWHNTTAVVAAIPR